jgi:hypothetical protein
MVMIREKSILMIFVQYIDLLQVPFLLLTCYESSRVRAMVFNVTFNTFSVISWRSVLLLEETGVPEKTHRPAASH